MQCCGLRCKLSRNLTYSFRRFTTATRSVATLDDGALDTFRRHAFQPEQPFVFPRGHFKTIPAINKWFTQSKNGESIEDTSLNHDYLSQFANINVPLEYTLQDSFARVDSPMIIFLEASRAHATSVARVYLAQAAIADLPQEMQDDVPAPELAAKAGKGDIYDSSIWLGQAPTYTPLHRDPNPNLYVQLAGSKTVRLLDPEVGHGVFARVQQEIGGEASATMRGEEMMYGLEREALERAVWGKGAGELLDEHMQECTLEVGDGLFIPKKWWHSVRSAGTGMTGSVNWWFR